jgi:hypothetical protein
MHLTAIAPPAIMVGRMEFEFDSGRWQKVVTDEVLITNYKLYLLEWQCRLYIIPNDRKEPEQD